MAGKFYVVWKGNNPGVYSDWNECNKQIKGYNHAIYKSFKTLDQAERAFKMDYNEFIGKEINQLGFLSDIWDKNIRKPELKSICVDAACSGNPGKMEYRGVEIVTGKELFHQGPFEDSTNNIGEFLAVVHAFAFLNSTQCTIPDARTLSVYSDSANAIKWIREKRAATKLAKSYKNQKTFELIRRAEHWLKANSYANRLLKWETSLGRKPGRLRTQIIYKILNL